MWLCCVAASSKQGDRHSTGYMMSVLAAPTEHHQSSHEYLPSKESSVSEHDVIEQAIDVCNMVRDSGTPQGSN